LSTDGKTEPAKGRPEPSDGIPEYADGSAAEKSGRSWQEIAKDVSQEEDPNKLMSLVDDRR